MSDRKFNSTAAPPPDLPMMQFGLRNLFVLVTAACIFLALLVAVPGYWKFVLLLILFSVGGHLTAAYVGTRLRAHSDRDRLWREAHGLDEAAHRRAVVSSPRLPLPVPPLGCQSTKLRWLPLAVAVGAMVGSGAGVWGLAVSIGDRITFAGLMMGGLSTAVLGGWITFVASGFVGIFRHAWRDAVTHEQSERNAPMRPQGRS